MLKKVLIIYFRLSYAQGLFQTFFFFNTKVITVHPRLILAHIYFEGTDKYIIPLHSHTTLITFLTVKMKHHHGSELYLVKSKLLLN